MNAALSKNPDEVLAKYYLALVYTRIGLKEEAKKYYQEVVASNSEDILTKYSNKALTCLDNPADQSCAAEKASEKEKMADFIESGEFLHPEIKDKIRDKEIQNVKDSFNSGKSPNMEHYRYINDASGEMPTDKQIADALKTLAKVGYNPMAQGMNQAYNPTMNNYNSQLAQLGMFQNSNNSNNNNFSNMLPYLLAQQQGGNTSQMNPQLLQTMLMNQATGGMGF